MIKCEAVFDGDLIYCQGKMIDFEQLEGGDYHAVDGELFETLEQAIKYCMGN